MISENRKYHFFGEIFMNRSRVLNAKTYPKDDKVKWLFLRVEEQQFSFVYKIEDPLKASFKKPFNIFLSFTMYEVVKDLIQLNKNYEILRGEENVGHVKLLSLLN